MENKPIRSFASDNNAGAHPQVIEAIVKANQGHVVAYGDDAYSESAKKKFEQHFGSGIDVFFVFNGTAANVLSLKSMTESFDAVICSGHAHIHNDECGAPEKFLGSKLLLVDTIDGKLTPHLVKPFLKGVGDQHHVQPKVISITQSTELGTVYSVSELKTLCQFAHDNNLLVHMDGARISNAAASLDVSLSAITKDVGVDVLSFGGTKNGLVGGEAVVFFNTALSKNFKFIRKQAMQLSSKMRFIAVQFETLLMDDLWKTSAKHANHMAQVLSAEISKIPKIKVTQKVQANGVFAEVPKEIIAPLQDKYFFYVWNEAKSEVRWMASFDTTEKDIQEFVATIKSLI